MAEFNPGGAADLNQAVKLRYEANADTNAFTDAEQAKLAGIAAGATANATDAQLRDRATHTGAQAISTVTGLQAALDAKEPADPTLTALAALNATAGLLEQTGADTFAKRTLGAAAADDIPTRADADARYAALSHGHAAATGAAAGFLSAADKTKLDGIAAGATANATDAQLRDRATHTGTQTATTISDFASAADARIAAASVNALADVTVTSPATGQVLKWNGTAWVNDTDATGGAGSDAYPSWEPEVYVAFNDFLSATADANWTFNNAGTGAASAAVTPPPDIGIGWISHALGTTATGRVSVFTPNTSNPSIFRFGWGIAKWKHRIRIPILSDATNTYAIRSGFLDSAAAESTDGAFFRYTHSVNGGRWEAVTRNNSTETAVNTGVALATNGIYKLEIEANAAGTSIEFRINGTLVATITTNIPTASGRDTGYGFFILRSAGTAAVTPAQSDYVYVEARFAAR